MSLTFTMDDVREHCSPPTNGWLPGADSIKMADEIDRLRAELAESKEDARQGEAAASRRLEDVRVREAAIARVRELCEGWPSWREVTAAEVLRALDGGE